MDLQPFQQYLSAAHVRRVAAGRLRPGADQAEGACLLVDIVGFTATTEQLAREGARGAERLSEVLSHTIGRIVDVIDQNGGDVLNFAGDAVLAVWQTEDRPLAEATLLAAQTALAVHDIEPHPTLPLRLRASVGAGPLTSFEVGGIEDRWMLVTAGTPLAQVAAADAAATAGEAVLSPEAWSLVDPRATGEDREGGTLLRSVDRPLTGSGPLALTQTDHDLRPYVPSVVGARAHQESFLAEFRHLTILFVNLTDLDCDDPESLEALHRAAVVCQEEVRRTDGAVYNFMSDEKGTTFMAAWGLAGSAHEDDAVRSLSASIGIRGRLGTRCGIGLASGRLFCGSYGGQRRQHYTIIGPTINLAARLMLASGGDGLLCDGRTRDAAAGRAEFEALESIRAKGIGEPVPVHRPLRLLRRQAASGELLIGRTEERARFAEALDASLVGRGAQLLLVGEAGIGKSQVVQHVVEEAGRRGIRVVQGAADSIENTTSWFAWRDVLTALVGDDTEVGLAALLGQGHRLNDRSPLLQDVCDLGLAPNDTTRAMMGPARSAGVAELLAALLDAAAREAPLVLVIEDAHWLDSASWGALGSVAAQAENLLIVVATRPISDPAPGPWTQLQGGPSAEVLSLDVLSPDEAVQIACRKLGAASLPTPVRELLARQAGGHPLYTEELAWALIEGGAIAIREGSAELLIEPDELDKLSLPDSLSGVITSRIDRLGPSGQLRLKIASVIGRVFTSDLLRAISPDTDEDADTDATELMEHDLVLPERPAPDLAWIFKHALVRDTAYNLLVFAQRRSLHRAVAEWYEQALGALSPHDYPLLAHHYALAEVPGKAREYLGLAGSRALQTGASAEAVSFFQRALALEEEHVRDRETALRQARWWRQLGLGYYALGKKREARDAMLRALELVGRPLRKTVPGLLFQLMAQYAVQARWLIAPKSLEASTELERALAAEAADANQYVSTTYYFDKENLPFFVAGLKCAAEAARAGATAPSAVGLAYVGVLVGLFQIDRLTMTYFHRSLAAAQEVGDPVALARHWQLRAMQRAGCGVWIEDELEDATRFFERVGDRHEYEVSVTVQGLIETYKGRYDEARTLYEELVASAKAHSIQHLVWGTYKLGELMLLEDGRHDEALPSQLEALELLKIEAEEPTEAAVGFLVGAIRHRQGDAVAASELIHTNMQRLKDSPPNTHGMLLAFTFGVWALLDIQDADPVAENRARLRFALKQFAIFTFLFPFAKGRMALFKARNAQHLGQDSKARKLLAKARAQGESTGMPLDVALSKLLGGDDSAEAELEALGAPWFAAWAAARSATPGT